MDDLEKLKKAVEEDPNINLNQLLIHACVYSRFPIVRFLVEKGADVTVNDNFVLITTIEKNGGLELVRFLVEKGADVTAQFNTPLIKACLHCNLEIVKFLVEKGADIHSGQNQPLCDSAFYGFFDIVKFLVEKGANVNDRNFYIITNASQNKSNFKVVEYLIKNGGNLESCSRYHKELFSALKFWKKWRRFLLRRWATKLLPVFYHPFNVGGNHAKIEFHILITRG